MFLASYHERFPLHSYPFTTQFHKTYVTYAPPKVPNGVLLIRTKLCLWSCNVNVMFLFVYPCIPWLLTSNHLNKCGSGSMLVYFFRCSCFVCRLMAYHRFFLRSLPPGVFLQVTKVTTAASSEAGPSRTSDVSPFFRQFKRWSSKSCTCLRRLRKKHKQHLGSNGVT